MNTPLTAARRAVWNARPLPAGIAGRVRELRERLSWTQETLATVAGVATITVRQIETEKRKPALDTAAKLARALGVAIEELLA